jgi:hypothetical protein
MIFVDEVEAKCDPSSIIQQQQEVAGNGTGAYSNGTSHSSSNYVFNKPTLDLENMGMAYGISGLYLQGNGVTGMGSSPSSPSMSMSMSQTGWMSPSMAASEKMNGLTLGQMTPTSYCPPASTLGYSSAGMAFPSARAMSVNAGTKPFMSSPPPAPVAQVVTSQPPPATNGLSRFGSQEILMAAAAENGAGLSSVKESTSPVLSPSSSDGKEHVERLINGGGENGLKMSQEKQYYGLQQPGLLRQDSGVDTTDFGDQVFDRWGPEFALETGRISLCH